MSTIKSAVICMCMLFATVSISRAQGWRGIVPLHSTRTDVERLLGSARETRGAASTYETQNERVLVFYSGEPCRKDAEWNVPRDTVVSFTVSPNSKMLVANLKLDATRYQRKPGYHVQAAAYYVNREEGIRVETRVFEGKDEWVESISYEAALKDKDLRCPGAPPVSSSEVDGPPAHKFDEYSNILLRDEKARLDNFAIYLQQNPKLMGYIIAYAGRRARAGEAKARADRAKSYLINERGIETGCIVTIDGGHRENLMVELYVALRGSPAPAPTPTVDPSEVQIIKAAGVKNNNRRSSRRERKS